MFILAGRDHGVEIGEAEPDVLAESGDEDALALLRHPWLRTDDPPVDRISEVVFQGAPDHLEGVALVMPLQMLDVFEKEGRRPVMPRTFSISKNRFPCFSSAKPCARPSEFFLRHPGKRERLTGKARKQHQIRE
jgi:hypothetical protein